MKKLGILFLLAGAGAPAYCQPAPDLRQDAKVTAALKWLKKARKGGRKQGIR